MFTIEAGEKLYLLRVVLPRDSLIFIFGKNSENIFKPFDAYSWSGPYVCHVLLGFLCLGLLLCLCFMMVRCQRQHNF